MNSILFPKPPPATPLPLDEWLIRTDRAESGREAFFRGRDLEYGVFQSALTSLSTGVIGGGTMVFQGAPGAGKTALMAECMEAVRRHSTPESPWVAVSLYPGTLEFPDRIVRSIEDAANMERQRLREKTSGAVKQWLGKCLDRGRQTVWELRDRGLTMGSVSWSQRKQEVSADGLFEQMQPFLEQFHIVVFVDEAQNIPMVRKSRLVLDCLHRPPQGIPLLAAFFGLSDTHDVLRECGLSRFARNRIVNLEPLLSADTSCAIRDSLVHYDFPGSAADLTTWVDCLTELSQGWPQHINSVAVAAVQVLQNHGGHFEPSLLEQTLALGQAWKEQYYAGRLAAGSSRAWVYRELALAAEDKGGDLTIGAIEKLTEQARHKAGETLNDFLTNALHAGLLAPARDIPDRYRIPIPSLGDYLRALPVEPE